MSIHDKSWPDAEGDRVTKHDQFNTHIGSYATMFGMSNTDTTSIDDDNQILHWMTAWHTTAAKEMVSLTEMKRLLLEGDENTPVTMFNFTVPTTAPATLKSGIFDRYLAWKKHITGQIKCTPEIKKILGFIGAELVIDPDQMKPTASLKASLANKVVINVHKGNYADSIAVYCHTFISGEIVPQDPGNDLDFTFVGSFISTPFTDFRLNQKKQPETRMYKFYYMKGDQIIGQASDILTVECKVYLSVTGNELQGKVK